MNQTKDNSYDNCSLVTNFCQIWKINTKVISVLLASVCYKAEHFKVIPERQRKEHYCSIT